MEFFRGTNAEMTMVCLKDRGFRETDISLLRQEGTGAKQFAHEKYSKAPEGAALGTTLGLFLGGFTGWLSSVGFHFSLSEIGLVATGHHLGF